MLRRTLKLEVGHTWLASLSATRGHACLSWPPTQEYGLAQN